MNIRTTFLSSVVILSLCPILAADSPAERAKALINAEFVFQPSVFSEDEFPKCDFLKPGQAREMLGKYEINVTYYSNDYQVVEKPARPGRYGAVVKIKAKDGRTYTRLRTLYKSPRRVSLFFGGLDGELAFRSAAGVEEETWRQQRQSVNDYLAIAVGRDIQRSHHFAVLLAGL